MNTYQTKLRHTLPAFLLVTISLVVLVSLVRWILLSKLGMDIKPVVWGVYIPVLLPWIPCILLINKKLNRPEFEGINMTSRIYLPMTCVITAGALLFMLNRYTVEARYNLTQIPDVTHVDSLKAGRYFKLKEYGVNKFGGNYIFYTKSAKAKSNRLRMNIYIALPLLKSRQQQITDFPRYWYAVQFGMWTNRRDPEYLRALEQEFLKECREQVNRMTFDNETYFERLFDSKEKDRYISAIRSIPFSGMATEFVVLKPYFSSFNHNALKIVYWFLAILAGGTVMFLLGLAEAIPPNKRTIITRD